MSEPKPSEILRPLLDERGNVKGDSDTYRDKLFAILNRLDAEQRRLAAKVDGPPVQPASEWPKWYTQGLCVVRVVSEKLDGDFWYPDGKLEVLNIGAWVVKDWPRIDHAKAIALIPAIANTHPLPAKPDPTTEEPKLAELERKLEAKSEEADTLHTKLSAAESECERLRGLIREFTESMTKTLNGGAA